MKVGICLKAVPDFNQAEIDPNSFGLKRERWVINPPDMSAVEECLKMKEACGCEAIVVSIIPPDTGEFILRRALILGADRAIGVWDSSFEGADTYAKSVILGRVFQEIAPDMILCGSRSIDTSSEVMGMLLAENLNLPVVCGVISLECEGKEEIIAHKKLERGGRETYRCRLPAVITVDQDINEPRYVACFSRSFRKGMKKPIERIKPDMRNLDYSNRTERVEVGQLKPRTKTGKKLDGLSVTEMMRVLRGESGSKKELFQGPPSEGARRLIEKISENPG